MVDSPNGRINNKTQSEVNLIDNSSDTVVLGVPFDVSNSATLEDFTKGEDLKDNSGGRPIRLSAGKRKSVECSSWTYKSHKDDLECRTEDMDLQKL